MRLKRMICTIKITVVLKNTLKPPKTESLTCMSGSVTDRFLMAQPLLNVNRDIEEYN